MYGKFIRNESITPAKFNTTGYSASAGTDLTTLDDVEGLIDALGLATMATQAADNVAITGGSISNTAIDASATLNLGAINAVTVNLGTGSANESVNIGTSGTNIINIGNTNSTVNINGTVQYENVENLAVQDKLITLNDGGAAGSATGSGIQFEEDAIITGYIKTTGGRDGFLFKAPGNEDDSSFIFTATDARSFTFPDTSGNVVIDTAVQTLSNKTINSSAFNGTIGATTPSSGLFTTIKSTSDVTFSASTANAGVIIQNEYSSGDADNSSQRIYFKESSNSSTLGFSIIYAGKANPTFGGQAFTLSANTLNILRHDNSEAGSTAVSISRATGAVTISGNVTTGDITGANATFSGRILGGINSSRSNIAGGNNPALQIEGSNSATSTASLFRNSNDNVSSTLFFGKSRGTTAGSNTAVASGDQIARILAAPSDGSASSLQGADIIMSTEGVISTGVVPMNIIFRTMSSSGTLTEGLRINSSQQITFSQYTGTGTRIPTVSSTGVLGALANGTNGHVLTLSSGAPVWAAAGSGGDVVGPASAVDNAIPRFDSTTGKLIQSSGLYLSDEASGYHIIHTGTTDGTDNKAITLVAGGAFLTGRGAIISLTGNEHAGAGSLVLQSGSMVSSYVAINASTTEVVRVSSTAQVGIGTGASIAGAKVHILADYDQLRLGYDSSNYLACEVQSNGVVSFLAEGTLPSFSFIQDHFEVVSATSVRMNVTNSAGDGITFLINDVQKLAVENSGVTIGDIEFVNDNDIFSVSNSFIALGNNAVRNIIITGSTLRPNLNNEYDFGDDTHIWRNGYFGGAVTAGSIVVGSPTGGNKGAGTINAQNGVFDNNTELTDYVFEKYYLGKAIDKKWARYKMKSLVEEMDFVEKHLHLSTMPGRTEWERDTKSLGHLVNNLWQTVETHHLYLSEHEIRIQALENKIEALQEEVARLKAA